VNILELGNYIQLEKIKLKQDKHGKNCKYKIKIYRTLSIEAVAPTLAYKESLCAYPVWRNNTFYGSLYKKKEEKLLRLKRHQGNCLQIIFVSAVKSRNYLSALK
jgi:hypothetical protein